MSVTLKEIYEKGKHKYSLKLHCRQDILNTPVEWVYLLEDIENNGFLRANELVITTGMQIHNSEDLIHLIDILAKRKCCGLLLNTGRYIMEPHITAEIQEYADKLDFPLLSMPWEVHIAEIMQNFCMMLSQQALIENNLTISFENALLTPEYSGNYMPTLSQEGYEKNGEYCVVSIVSHIAPEALKRFFSALIPKCNIINHKNYTVLILYNNQIDQFNSVFNKYENKKELESCTDIIGIGNRIKGIANLHQSYNKSLFALKVAQYKNNKKCLFSELGIFRIFYEIKDAGILEDISQNILHPLIEYDENHKSEYFETLKIYLTHGSSILETAVLMNTHRNTINYRIKKIKEILNRDLDDPQYVFQLMLAFNIKEYMGILE